MGRNGRDGKTGWGKDEKADGVMKPKTALQILGLDGTATWDYDNKKIY